MSNFKSRSISLAASLAIKSARKAAKKRNVETGKIGRPMFLERASLYVKVKNEGQDNESEKTMIRGFDAVKQVPVAGIEYHGEWFDGELEDTMFSNFYVTKWKVPTTGYEMKFKHLCGPVAGIDAEAFWSLVTDAQEAFIDEPEEDEAPKVQSIA